MRTYLILKDKAEQWNKSAEIHEILSEFSNEKANGSIGKFSADGSAALLSSVFDRQQLASKGLAYERLDQLTMDILFGVN